MFDFDRFFHNLKDGAEELARQEASDYISEASADGKEFLDSMKEDLKTWTKQLADGELKNDELEFLIRGKKDLAKMKALTQAGMAAVRVDRMRTAVVDLVVKSAASAV